MASFHTEVCYLRCQANISESLSPTKMDISAICLLYICLFLAVPYLSSTCPALIEIKIILLAMMKVTTATTGYILEGLCVGLTQDP